MCCSVSRIRGFFNQYTPNVDQSLAIPMALSAITGAALVATDFSTSSVIGGSSLGFVAGKVYCHPNDKNRTLSIWKKR